MAQTKQMTLGRPASLIFTFALPLMVGNVFQQLYTVVDTMVVGKALGVQALAALGAADWMNWLMLSVIQGLTQGFGILMAQHFGAGKAAPSETPRFFPFCPPFCCLVLDRPSPAPSFCFCRLQKPFFPIRYYTCASCILEYPASWHITSLPASCAP